MQIKPMYKVELTEKEVREVGAERYVKTIWKRKVITFIIGLCAVALGAYFWEFPLGKGAMILSGIIWVAYTLYLSRKEGKAGAKFLEDIKNG